MVALASTSRCSDSECCFSRNILGLQYTHGTRSIETFLPSGLSEFFGTLVEKKSHQHLFAHFNSHISLLSSFYSQ